MDEPIESLKTALVALAAWIAGAFMDNPVGTVTAIVGLLYVFEKWRTQKALRRKAENELEKDEDGEDTGTV